MESPKQYIPVTLDAIALRAKVSKNTVSIALRNKPGVGRDTRERILKIAEEMGYKPNPMISALMHNLRAVHPVQSQSNIAFLHNFKTRHEWREMEYSRVLYAGIEERCAQTGFTASVFWSREPDIRPERLRDILLSQGISGIVVGPVILPRRHIRLLCDEFALSTLGYSLWRPALHRACTDMRTALATAIRELKKLNYRRIGVAYSPESDSRVEYSWTAAVAVEMVKSPGLLRKPFANEAVTSDMFARWLQKETPDVVVSAGLDGTQGQLSNLGYRIPEDLGFVQILGDSSSSPQAATVERHWNALGAAAVDLITAQLMRNERGIPESRRTVLIEGRWRQGATIRQQRAR